jgi:hypothetical protein
VQRGLEIPFWLDHDLLFRLNYGPAPSQDVERMKTQNGKSISFPVFPRNIITSNRAAITLLDRPLAAKFVAALYGETGSIPNQRLTTSVISAFSYNPAWIETYSLVWVENFVIYHVWNKHYSSSILGGQTRPPMAAVVMDMIDMIEYFRSISGSTSSKVLREWLTDFFASRTLKSLCTDKAVDQKLACEGYLADLFSIVACLPRDEYSTLGPPAELGWDADVKATLSGRICVGRPSTSLLTKTLPGPGVFFSSEVPPVEVKEYESLEDLDASFIESGAFRFRLTNRIEHHLALDNDNHIHLYKNAEKLTERAAAGDVDFTDHPFSLEIYGGHSLRGCATFLGILKFRLFDLSALEEEMHLTLSVVFWRKEESRRIAKRIFTTPEPRTWQNLFSSGDLSTRDKVRILESMGFPPSLIFGSAGLVPKGTIHLKRFRHFRNQLGYLREQMRAWKPRTVREMFVPGYYDRFAWFVAIFGMAFGIIASLGLVAQMVQIALAVVQLQGPV